MRMTQVLVCEIVNPDRGSNLDTLAGMLNTAKAALRRPFCIQYSAAAIQRDAQPPMAGSSGEEAQASRCAAGLSGFCSHEGQSQLVCRLHCSWQLKLDCHQLPGQCQTALPITWATDMTCSRPVGWRAMFNMRSSPWAQVSPGGHPRAGWSNEDRTKRATCRRTNATGTSRPDLLAL